MDLTILTTKIQIGVILMGLIGNVLTFIIFSRPAFKKNSISTYCRALAVVDSFIVYELASDIGFVFFDYFIIVMSEFGCKLSFYINICFSSISAWIIITFSIDKLLSMKNRAKFLKKRSFQYAMILAIVLIHLVAYIVPIYMVSVTISKAQILCYLESFGSVLVLVCLIEGSIIPFIIMIGSSIISIRMLRNSAKNIHLHFNESDILNRTTRDFKYAITSISFNALFVVLKLPIILVTILEGFIPDISNVAICLTYLFYLIYFSCGFLIHLASNSIFKRELLVLLRLRKPSQVIYLNQTPNSRIQKPSTMGRKRLSLFL